MGKFENVAELGARSLENLRPLSNSSYKYKCEICHDSGMVIYVAFEGTVNPDTGKMEYVWIRENTLNMKREDYLSVLATSSARCRCKENLIMSKLRGIFKPAGLDQDYWITQKFKDYFAVSIRQKKVLNFLREWHKLLASENICYIYGSTGKGKTHLAIAWLCKCVWLSKTDKAVFIGGADLGNAIRQSVREEPGEGLFSRIINAEYLVIDDIQTLHAPSGESFTMQEFSRLINRRYTSKCLTVITSNYDLGDKGLARHCGEFGYTIASRIKGNGKRLFNFNTEGTEDVRSKKQSKQDEMFPADDELPM